MIAPQGTTASSTLPENTSSADPPGARKRLRRQLEESRLLILVEALPLLCYLLTRVAETFFVERIYSRLADSAAIITGHVLLN